MKFKYVASKLAVCPTCSASCTGPNNKTPHYKLDDEGAYLCRHEVNALLKKQEQYLLRQQQQIHEVERGIAAWA